ncbi:uncharacterized protein F4817DRAFT_244578 [Daldinia loculata]|uniref:uncharacterized protein n=1 Tax=Daldinia loculata TaxID=103429 RepID=UPI0020C471C8|nr:uncharacterized protein F4817DRAFT_244578 [Daldinia loculata]KAI1643812.1 hypothetical protein F4817DRAFT_244578 [Daldinia loculata]
MLHHSSLKPIRKYITQCYQISYFYHPHLPVIRSRIQGVRQAYTTLYLISIYSSEKVVLYSYLQFLRSENFIEFIKTRGRQDIYFSITMASEKQSPPPPYLEISSSVSPGNKAANYGHDNAVAQSGEGHSSESHGDRNLTGQAGTDGHWNINEGNRNQTLQISSVVAIVIITGFLAVAYVLGSLLFLLFHLFKEKLMAH